MKRLIPVLLLAAGYVAAGTTPVGAQKVVREPAKPNFETSGSINFRQYCAPCHGVSGKGDGPAAPALKTKPADLTKLTERYNGNFPEDRIRAFILGEVPEPAHGKREMPVWGPVFYDISGKDYTLYDKRMRNLLDYLRQIQVKPAR